MKTLWRPQMTVWVPGEGLVFLIEPLSWDLYTASTVWRVRWPSGEIGNCVATVFQEVDEFIAAMVLAI